MNLFGMNISEKIYMPIVIIIIGFISYLIINTILSGKFTITRKLSKHQQRSRRTVLLLIKGVIRIVIMVVVILSILQVYGVNTSALIAGLSAVTVVIGLAFQDILKDFLVGAAIILESQYAIGEIVSINGFKGEVISLNLRCTRIKSLTGEVRIIANRNISEVTNYSLDSVLVKIPVSVAYESDIAKVEKVLNELKNKLDTQIEELTSPITIEGVESLGTSSMDFLLTLKTSARNQYKVRREILKEVKMAFDKNKIKIPYTQIEVHNGK